MGGRRELGIPEDTTPVVRVARVAFAEDGREGVKQAYDQRAGKPLVSALARARVKGSRSSELFRSQRAAPSEIQSCLKKTLSQLPTDRVFPQAYKHAVQLVHVTSAPLTGVTTGAMSRLAPSCEEPLLQHNIELCTLKFVDSPSVDETLCEWYLPPAHLANAHYATARLATSPVQNNDTFRGNEQTASDVETLVSVDTNKNISFKDRTGASPKGGTLKGCIGFPAKCAVKCESICGEPRQDSCHSNETVQARASYNSPGPEIKSQPRRESQHQNPRGESQHQNSYREPAEPARQPYPKPCPQPCCSAGFHQGFNSDRRLPDYVTIDQCYSGVDDSECRTICIMANFETGAGEADQRTHHGHAPKRGGTGETSARRERISLRRGVMMRQMSLNTNLEQDMHLLSGRFF